MKNRNIVSIDGRLTRSAEIRQTKTGREVLSFSLAVNGWKDETSFFDFVMWGSERNPNRLSNLSRFLTKGKLIGVSGSLKQTRWSGNDGKTRSKVEIIADEVFLLEPKSAESAPEPVEEIGLYDADIPF